MDGSEILKRCGIIFNYPAPTGLIMYVELMGRWDMLIFFGNCIIISSIIIIIVIIMFLCGGFVDLGRSEHRSILECKGDNHF